MTVGEAWVIVVTGGRRFADPDALHTLLDEAAGTRDPDSVVLRHGRCNPRNEAGDSIAWDRALTLPPMERWDLDGSDWHAHWYGLLRGWQVQERPADWGRYGKAAGGIRNQAMIDETPRPDVVVAAPDPWSRGTWDCVRRAEAAGVPVRFVGRT